MRLPDAPRTHHELVQPFSVGVSVAEKGGLTGEKAGSTSTIVGMDLAWRAPGNRISASTTVGWSGSGATVMGAVKLRLFGFGKAR